MCCCMCPAICTHPVGECTSDHDSTTYTATTHLHSDVQTPGFHTVCDVCHFQHHCWHTMLHDWRFTLLCNLTRHLCHHFPIVRFPDVVYDGSSNAWHLPYRSKHRSNGGTTELCSRGKGWRRRQQDGSDTNSGTCESAHYREQPNCCSAYGPGCGCGSGSGISFCGVCPVPRDCPSSFNNATPSERVTCWRRRCH